jgi:uncharacterized protein (DUF1015 family)
VSIIRPFRAVRPIHTRVNEVAAVPYDVVNQSEARQIVDGNPWSFLHVSRAEIDLPEGLNPYSSDVYSKASSNFKYLIEHCPLMRESQNSLYVYRLRMGEHEQTGVVGCFSIDEYDSNQIKKHEKTRPDKEDDRTQHMLSLSAQTGPVFLTYRDVVEIDVEVAQVKAQTPIYDFVAVDGVAHTVWLIPDPSELVQLFASRIPALYIADGHHRAAAASRVREVLAKANPRHMGGEDYNFVLAVAFPASQLQVLPYHRVIRDLRQMTEADFLDQIKARFEVSLSKKHESQPGVFGMYLKSGWYHLRLKGQKAENNLDVDLLQSNLLGPILGIIDPRSDKRIDFVGGIRGIRELENKVNSGEFAVAFAMHPTRLSQVMEVSDQNGIMPPKSTWFEPKLRDGLFCHVLSS